MPFAPLRQKLITPWTVWRQDPDLIAAVTGEEADDWIYQDLHPAVVAEDPFISWDQYLADADKWKDPARDMDSTQEIDMRELREMLRASPVTVPQTIDGGFT